MRSARLPARFWILTAAALLGVLVTLVLGFWQLSRASEKLALQAAIDGQQLLPELDVQALQSGLGKTASNKGVVYRMARLRGSWITGHTLYLDNRQMNAKPGFFVLTPFKLENSGLTVVVQRGWVQRNFTDRTQVSPVPTAPGLVEITGRIAPPPSKLYEFAASQDGMIRQNLDLPAFSREVGVPLAAVSVLQLGPAGDGLQRDWPRVNTGIEKHYGYAFQWFALCGLIAFLYGWFQIVRRFISPR